MNGSIKCYISNSEKGTRVFLLSSWTRLNLRSFKSDDEGGGCRKTERKGARCASFTTESSWLTQSPRLKSATISTGFYSWRSQSVVDPHGLSFGALVAHPNGSLLTKLSFTMNKIFWTNCKKHFLPSIVGKVFVTHRSNFFFVVFHSEN